MRSLMRRDYLAFLSCRLLHPGVILARRFAWRNSRIEYYECGGPAFYAQPASFPAARCFPTRSDNKMRSSWKLRSAISRVFFADTPRSLLSAPFLFSVFLPFLFLYPPSLSISLSLMLLSSAGGRMFIIFYLERYYSARRASRKL